MFPIFPNFLQNRPDRGGGAGGGPKILVCYKTNDGVKKGGLGQNMNYDNDICILHMYLSAGVHISRRDARHGLKLGQGTMEI